MLQSQLQRCQPCACGKGIPNLGLAQAVQVAQVALQHSLAQVRVMMVMPQRLGRMNEAVLAASGALVLRGLGQELLEHFLLVNEAVMDPVRYHQVCQ